MSLIFPGAGYMPARKTAQGATMTRRGILNAALARLGWLCRLDPRPTELISGMALVFLGLALVGPAQSIGPSKDYAVLLEVAGKTSWGMLALVLGFGQLFALLHLGRPVRIALAWLSAIFWSFSGILLFLGNPESMTPPLYIVLGTACIWAQWQISVDHNGRYT